MPQEIPVNLKYLNRTTDENDHLLPTTTAEQVRETDTKQFISAGLKAKIENKQDKLGYTPLNRSGDTMAGPLILSADSVTERRQAVTKDYVDTKVAALVNGSPEALDTLYELADAINQDPNFAVTVSTMTGRKMDKTEAVAVAEPNKLLYLDSNGELDTNAKTATKLKTPFLFSLDGDVTMSAVEIDGSGNITGSVSIEQLTADEVESIFQTAT